MTHCEWLFYTSELEWANCDSELVGPITVLYAQMLVNHPFLSLLIMCFYQSIFMGSFILTNYSWKTVKVVRENIDRTFPHPTSMTLSYVLLITCASSTRLFYDAYRVIFSLNHFNCTENANSKSECRCWSSGPYGLVGRPQRFRETYCLCFRPEDGDSMFLWNVGVYLQGYMVLLSRRPTLTSSLPWEHQITYMKSESLEFYIKN
jgi:hypothetical protein